MDQTGWGSTTGSSKEFSSQKRPDWLWGPTQPTINKCEEWGWGNFPRCGIYIEQHQQMNSTTRPISNSCGAENETAFDGQQWNVPHGQQMADYENNC
jgi:hypothetical protein